MPRLHHGDGKRRSFSPGRASWSIAGALLAMAVGAVAACAQNVTRPATPSPGSAVEGAGVMPGEVIVEFRAGTESVRIDEILAAAGGRRDRLLGSPRFMLVRPHEGDSAAELITRLRRYEEVLYANPNPVRRVAPPRSLPDAKPVAP